MTPLDFVWYILAIAILGFMVWFAPKSMSIIATFLGAESAGWWRSFFLLVVNSLAASLVRNSIQFLGLSGLGLLCTSLIFLLAIEGGLASLFFGMDYWKGFTAVFVYTFFWSVVYLILIGLLVVLGGSAAPVIPGGVLATIITL